MRALRRSLLSVVIACIPAPVGPALAQVPVLDQPTASERQSQASSASASAQEAAKTKSATAKTACSFSRTATQAWNDRQDVAQKIIAAADKYGVDRAFALSIAYQETQFNQGCVSPAGAVGVMQLMPDTARDLGVDPWDTDQNIDGGVRYLKQMLIKFDGNQQLAAAAYNAGPNRQSLKQGRIPDIAETKNYVARVFGNHKPQFDTLLGGSPTPVSVGANASMDAIGNAYSSIDAFGGSSALAMVQAFQAASAAAGVDDRLQDAWDANSAAKLANMGRLNELLYALSSALALSAARKAELQRAQSERLRTFSVR